MRPSPSIEPFTPSPDIALPHPVLRAALDNLDVQLEEELVRYRRQRRLQVDGFKRPAAQPRLSGLDNRLPPRRSRAGIELPSFKELDGKGNLPIGNSADIENPVKAILGGTIAEQHRTAPKAAEIQSGVAFKPSQAETVQPPELFLSTEAPLAHPTSLEELEEQPSTGGIASYAQQPDLSAFAPSATLQKLAHEQRETQLPEDYLASSEELLKSIEEEAPLRARRRADLLDVLLTPLGVGSMLLLLLSSATLGFLIMNPATLTALFASPPTAGSDATSAPAASPSSSPLMRVPTMPIDSAPPSPDLSAEEFRDVNLNTLSTLPSSAKTNAARQNRPVAQASPQAPADGQTNGQSQPTNSGENAAPSPQPDLPTVPVQSQPAIEQPPAYTPPAYTPPPYTPPPYSPPAYSPSPATSPAASPAAPAPTVPTTVPSPTASRSIDVPPPETAAAEVPQVATAPSASPAAEDYYYVGTDYSSDSSLQEARQTVPDAYVRNLPSGGAIVQTGAFSSEAAAEARVQELQQQGLPAQIYRP